MGEEEHQADWKKNASDWRDAYRQLRDETDSGDPGYVVRMEADFRRLAGFHNQQVLDIAAKLSAGQFYQYSSPLVLDVVAATIEELDKDREDGNVKAPGVVLKHSHAQTSPFSEIWNCISGDRFRHLAAAGSEGTRTVLLSGKTDAVAVINLLADYYDIDLVDLVGL